MNIGVESKTSFTESNGISILTTKLQSNGFIKCHFTENDKTPNTDGFFVLSNSALPQKEFHVQIKSTETMQQSGNEFTYQCNTKFINYVNLRVTENPAFIFVVDTINEKVYFKYLSDKFLEENNFLNSEQETVSLHFNEYEVLNDIDTFYKLVQDILLDRRITRFNTQQVDVIEYQTAFDKLNNFFDCDFIKLKEVAFPNVWKFGIVYNREQMDDKLYNEIKYVRDQMGVKVSPYYTNFSAYRVEYGDKSNIFQNFKVDFNEKNLKLETYISHGNGAFGTIDEEINNWLHNTFKNLILNKICFVPFFPNDVLYEIVYNFIDKNNLNEKLNTQRVIDIKNLIDNKYPGNYVNNDINLLKATINELLKRDIVNIERVWRKTTHNHFVPNFCGVCIDDIKYNNEKLFKNIPAYYNEFIKNLFGNEFYYKYKKQGYYLMFVKVDMLKSYLTNEYRYISNPNAEFEVDLTNDINEIDNCEDECFTRRGSGLIRASFRNDENNILNNLLSILYAKVCEIYGFKKEHINLKADFR